MEGQIITFIFSNIGLTIITGIGTYFLRKFINRLDNMEEDLKNSISEDKVRSLISDKITSLATQIQDLKTENAKLFDLYLKGK